MVNIHPKYMLEMEAVGRVTRHPIGVLFMNLTPDRGFKQSTKIGIKNCFLPLNGQLQTFWKNKSDRSRLHLTFQYWYKSTALRQLGVYLDSIGKFFIEFCIQVNVRVLVPCCYNFAI